MSNTKEVPNFDQAVENVSTNIDPSVLPPEPHPPIPIPIPDPTGIALLFIALVAASELGYRAIRGKS